MTFLDAAPRQTEKQWMAAVVALAEVLGWRYYHTFDSRRSAPGFPDLVLVRRPRVVWLELKTDRGRLTDDQAAWIGDLVACGMEVYIARPRDADKLAEVLR